MLKYRLALIAVGLGLMTVESHYSASPGVLWAFGASFMVAAVLINTKEK